MCVNLRKNARDERTLFYYNGHGVPKPTNGGEIWVFNKSKPRSRVLSLTPRLHTVHPRQFSRPPRMAWQPVYICLGVLRGRKHHQQLQAERKATR